MSLKIQVEEIGEVQPNAFNGLTKTTFMSQGKIIYIFTKAGNDIKQGDILEGDIAPDKSGNLKFTKVKNDQWNAKGNPAPYTGPKKGQSQGGRDDNAIKAQWAIGQAVQVNLTAPEFNFDAVEADAKKLYAMISRVKDSDQPKTDVVISAEDTNLEIDWNKL